MIFVTVGTQLPFPRLISAMNAWASLNRSTEVIAQTGFEAKDAEHLVTRERVDAAEFGALVERADLVVAHAGMGTIITALDLGKPVIIMPRRASLGEHRNDHQLATAEKFGHLANLRVVNDATELGAAIDSSLQAAHRADPGARTSDGAQRLIREVQEFISGAPSKVVVGPNQRTAESYHAAA